MVIGKKLCYTNDTNKLARWCNVFTSKTEKEFKKWVDGLMEEEAVSKLTGEVNHYSSDDEVIALYSAYTKEELERNTMLEDAEAKGKTEGKIEGKMEKSLEIAKNMLNENINISLISKVTGLSKTQIEKLDN